MPEQNQVRKSGKKDKRPFLSRVHINMDCVLSSGYLDIPVYFMNPGCVPPGQGRI